MITSDGGYRIDFDFDKGAPLLEVVYDLSNFLLAPKERDALVKRIIAGTKDIESG